MTTTSTPPSSAEHHDAPTGSRTDPGTGRRPTGTTDGIGWLRQRRDPGEEPYTPRRGTLFLLWSAGVDRDLLVTRAEYYRYAGTGLFVLVVAGLAVLSSTLFMVSVLQGFHPAILIVALVWGAVVYVLDRSIVADPSYGSLVDAPRLRDRIGPALVRGGAYLVRILVAVLIAFVVGESLVLTIFRPEIDAEIAKVHNERIAEANQAYLPVLDTQIRGFDQPITDQTTRLEDAQRAVTGANDNYRFEVTENGGVGAIARGQVKQREDAQTALTAAESATSAAIADLRAKKKAAEDRKAAVQLGDEAVIKDIPDLARQHEDIRADRGLVTQEKAFRRYQQADEPTFMVSALPWALRGILLLIDLMPLFLKLGGGATLYGRRLKQRAAAIARQDRADDDEARALLRTRQVIGERRREVDRDMALLREQQREDARTEYLHRTDPGRPAR